MIKVIAVILGLAIFILIELLTVRRDRFSHWL